MNTQDTRSRLINTMQRSLQRNGLHGTGLTQLLSLAKAPKGSLYHHFPGGKEELALAAIAQTADQLERFFTRLFSEHADPLDAVAHWIESALQRMEASQFSLGCPLASAALDSSPDDLDLRLAINRAFNRVQQQFAAHISAAGYPADYSQDLAALLFSSYEGGLIMARVAGDTLPLERAFRALLTQVRLQQKVFQHER
ncbi:TetR/AcrR family transcriptional regulator, lmrAB and yxaGH operons repressor [Halopseudomonas sabulinigri]|uniref:TetR/AcrR family transcriptional regulator, lmrAB and yxaGH operons repressor n=1 Tax=Halopseudomonas sabulinigri TaxID=472181 RepID=A0A1H1TK46_9GAMM|nr:TetR/AcrR family transcriptional regulator [Halopseudomonas sabulinigri]SDS60617.1 TetR/AcrR family transcriptional regulator, lmrAB and yxaGH operons repressor [Halopseudomonas sabulinigri]